LALDNRYLRVNAELCRITGYSEQELLSLGFTDITHPDDYEKNMKLTRQMLAGDFDSFQMDKRYLRKDGKIIWVRLFARIVKGASGKPLYFFPMVEDITDRKRAEDALCESQEKYRLVVENASDAIFVIQDGFIQFPNPKTMELSGYTAEELSRMSFLNIVHPDDRKEVQERYLRRIAGEKFLHVHSYRCLNRSGEVVWVQTNSVPTLWNGKPATINFVRDITQEKKLEGHLLQAQKMEAIGTLAGGIAHDFNNILTAILGYAELAALDLKEDSQVKNNLGQSIKAAHRARDLVSQILAFSRQGKQERRPLNIIPLIKEDLKLLRASLPATLEIRQKIEKDAGTIEADPTQIHQILMNLGTNAAHAMSEKGGILEVSLANFNVDGGRSYSAAEIAPGSYLRLRVSDTGCGMPPEILKKIFDPYFTTKEVGKGTGLGLAVVHGIVNSYGGGIIVSSEPGKGSTFDIYFPRVEACEVSRAADKIESMPLGRRERILLVDDESAIADIGRNLLEHLGYKVVARTSSVEALELFRAHPERFDLVITDMTMPNLTGDRLAQKLLKIRSEIPVILCTGFSERITEEKARALGIREFVMKPLVMKDMAQAIRRALDPRAKR
jgi:PAS domain S-box-containing protein